MSSTTGSTTTLTITLPREMKAQIEALASATGRDESFLAEEALRHYLAVESAPSEAIQRGLAAADADDFATDEEMRDLWASFELENAKTPATIDLPDELYDEARRLAQTTGHSLDEVLAEAVANGLAYARWFHLEVERGHRSALRGPLVPADEVWTEFLRRGLLTLDAMAQADEEGQQDDSVLRRRQRQ